MIQEANNPVALNKSDITDFIHYAIEHDHPAGLTSSVKEEILKKIKSLGYSAPDFDDVWDGLLGASQNIPGEELIDEFSLYPAGTNMIFAGSPSRRQWAEGLRDEQLHGTTGAYASVYQIIIKPKSPALLSYTRNLALRALGELFGHGSFRANNDGFTNGDGHGSFAPYSPHPPSPTSSWTPRDEVQDRNQYWENRHYNKEVRQIYPFREEGRVHPGVVTIQGNRLVFKMPLILDHVHLLFDAMQRWITPSQEMADSFYFNSVEEVRGPGLEPDGSGFSEMKYSNEYADTVDQVGNLETVPAGKLLPAALDAARELHRIKESSPQIILPQIADIALRTLKGEWRDVSGRFPTLKELSPSPVSGAVLEDTIHQRCLDIMAEIAGVSAGNLSREELLEAFNHVAAESQDERDRLLRKSRQDSADLRTLENIGDAFYTQGLSLGDLAETKGMEGVFETYANLFSNGSFDEERGDRTPEEFCRDLAALELKTRDARKSREESKAHGGRIMEGMQKDQEEQSVTGQKPDEDVYSHTGEAMFGSRENWEKFREYEKKMSAKEIKCSFYDFLQGKTHTNHGSNFTHIPGPQIMRSFSGAGWVSYEYTTRNAGFPLPRLPLPEKLVPYCTKFSTPAMQALLKFTAPLP